MADHMRTPCDNCPFRRDAEPFLRAERVEILAYSTDNPYATFDCHKTLAAGRSPLGCAGFLSMQVNAGGSGPDGFEVSDLVYEDAFDMIEAYRDREEAG